MQKYQNRCIIVIGLMLVFAGLVVWVQYKHPGQTAHADISKIPLNIAGWQGKEIPEGDNIRAILETDAILMREYRKGDDIVWVAIVYYRDTKVALHLPESCYVGQGADITEESTEKINDSLEANKLLIKGDIGEQAILYYFQSGTFTTSSYQSLRWHMALNRIKGKNNSGALVRFSAPLRKSPEETLKNIKEFIITISPLLAQYLI